MVQWEYLNLTAACSGSDDPGAVKLYNKQELASGYFFNANTKNSSIV